MQINHPTTLTLDDHTQLEQLMCTLTGSRDEFAALVRRKLESAVIIHSEDADAHLVTSGRQVRYRVNGETVQEHVLSWDRAPIGDLSTLSLQDNRGLALLGMRVGQSMSLPTDGGRMTIKVESVVVTAQGNAPLESGTSLAPLQVESLGSRLQLSAYRFLRGLKRGFARMQKGRTETVLMRLSDATLRDIGITRSEIPYVSSVVAGLRDRALFDLAIDSKLRGCDLVKIKIGTLVAGPAIRSRSMVIRQKTSRPVQFEITADTRASLLAWLERRGGTIDDFAFPAVLWPMAT